MSFSASSPGAGGSVTNGGLVLTDFTADQADLGWFVVNDNVMGGRSEGDFEIEEGELRFTGRTNTRGGGFSSIRTRPVALDLSKYAGIRLHVRGDGRRYTWRLTTDAQWRGREVAYWADFDTRDAAWTTVDVPFADFVPRFRGTQLDGPGLDNAQITSMGLMIYDNEDGPFDLRLASVGAYPARAPFAFEQFRWHNRVLVVSAASPDDRNLARVQDELAAMSAEFADRDLVLVTLLDTGTSTAGDRQLTAAEVAANRADLQLPGGEFALRLIGKDGTVKLEADSATPVAGTFALIDTMPMRQREIRER